MLRTSKTEVSGLWQLIMIPDYTDAISIFFRAFLHDVGMLFNLSMKIKLQIWFLMTKAFASSKYLV